LGGIKNEELRIKNWGNILQSEIGSRQGGFKNEE
jgi:hypothetical protein